MRTLKELYTILLDRNDYKDSICLGITKLCLWHHKITEEEKEYLRVHFKAQRPGLFKHTKFMFNSNYNVIGVYWWSRYDTGNEQRTRFIKHLISKL
jgi:uncharacterized protein (DUF1499 family)